MSHVYLPVVVQNVFRKARPQNCRKTRCVAAKANPQQKEACWTCFWLSGPVLNFPTRFWIWRIGKSFPGFAGGQGSPPPVLRGLPAAAAESYFVLLVCLMF